MGVQHAVWGTDQSNGISGIAFKKKKTIINSCATKTEQAAALCFAARLAASRGGRLPWRRCGAWGVLVGWRASGVVCLLLLRGAGGASGHAHTCAHAGGQAGGKPTACRASSDGARAPRAEMPLQAPCDDGGGRVSTRPPLRWLEAAVRLRCATP